MEGRRHGGDIYQGGITWDFSVNVNPLGIPFRVRQAIRESADRSDRYPDTECRELVKELAEYHGTEGERIVCGSGAADLIYRLVYLLKPCRALILAPTFSEYEQALKAVGCRVRYCRLKEEQDFQADIGKLADMAEEGELIFLCNPNNPTGLAADKEQVELLAKACRRKKGFLILDECFCEFLERPKDYSFMERIQDYPEAVILRAFTKSYAMAGLRLGYGISSDTELLEKMKMAGAPWSVSGVAQVAGIAALREVEYLDRAVRLIKTEREYLERELSKLGYQVYPSMANYLMFRAEEELYQRLLERGVLIRQCGNYRGLGDQYYRICVGLHKENEQLIRVMRE